MAAATAEYYFRFRICWCHCLQKVKVYKQTKFRRDISIGGWDITTSGFEIQTSAILEFYFRFRSWPFRRNRRVILHPVADFRPNRNMWRLAHQWSFFCCLTVFWLFDCLLTVFDEWYTVPVVKNTQNHWCTNRHRSTKTVQTVYQRFTNRQKQSKNTKQSKLDAGMWRYHANRMDARRSQFNLGRVDAYI